MIKSFLIDIFLIHQGILGALVLADDVLHVDLGLAELRLLHPLCRVLVEEGLASEQGGELAADPPQQLRDGGGVGDDGGGALEAGSGVTC